MSDRPDHDQEPVEPPAEKEPTSMGDIPITDRWSPLVRDPESTVPLPGKQAQRVLAALLSLIVLLLFLWALA